MGSRTHDLAGAPLVIKLDDDVQTLHVLGVGAGVVGRATGLALRDLGHRVRFADIDDGVVERLRAEGLEASHMANLDLAGVDLVLVSVQTPTFEDHADLRYLEAAIADIGEALGRAAASEPDRYRVVVVRSTALLLGSTRWSAVPVRSVPFVATAVPRRWPKIGWDFHVIAGTVGASANIGCATVSYCDGCVSALMSSARPTAPLRVPASVIASGVRYE